MRKEIRVFFELRLTAEQAATPLPLSILWTQPATNIKGVWTSGGLYEKRLRADWEAADVESRISVDAPVISVFGHKDENRLTFAWSDPVNTVKNSPLQSGKKTTYSIAELIFSPKAASPSRNT